MAKGIKIMGRARTCGTVDREQIVLLLNRLPREDAARRLRTTSALAWIGIQARKRDTAVRGRLNAAARGRVGATYFLPALELFPSLPMPARREMALALGDLAGGVAVTRLARLATSPNAEARLIAVDALGKIGGPEAVAALKTAAGDSNEAVRAEAVRSLGQLAVAEAKKDAAALKEASVEALLLDVSAGDPSDYVQQVASEALAAIREASPSRALAWPEHIPATEVPVSTLSR
jgi:hypothetical protein